jgi:hypothetical protein
VFQDASLSRAHGVSPFVGRLTLAHAMGENPVVTASNLVARRAVFDQAGGFDPSLSLADGQEWVARVLASTQWQVRGLDIALVDARSRPACVSGELVAQCHRWQAMIERVRTRAPERTAAAESEARALFERGLARRALRSGRSRGRALSHFRAAMRHSPRTLLTNQPRRTLLTGAGALAAVLLPDKFVQNLRTKSGAGGVL